MREAWRFEVSITMKTNSSDSEKQKGITIIDSNNADFFVNPVFFTGWRKPMFSRILAIPYGLILCFVLRSTLCMDDTNNPQNNLGFLHTSRGYYFRHLNTAGPPQLLIHLMAPAVEGSSE